MASTPEGDGMITAEVMETILNADAELRSLTIWEPVLIENTLRGEDDLRATVFRYRPTHESGCWFKIVGKVVASLEEVYDLLDTNLLPRQKEWHFLFIEGKILATRDNLELCWMAYDSDSALVSDRDFLYYK